MPSDSWDEEAVFHIARKLTDPAERAMFLERVCGDDLARRQRIEAMLKVFEQDQSFLKSEPSPTVRDEPVPEKPGVMVGPYKLLQRLGEGGMGIVFLADQIRPVARRVALKIIKPGMDTNAVIARFEAERQALAMMDHPNIAHVLDAGTTDTGLPYFVMELVKGRPITQYCDEQRLTVEQRMKMFLTICRAVQHAHQKGVIHRDLKPSNILVAEYDDEAVPKIIDFGVAKAISQRLTDKTMFTAIGQIVGTLEYMSPEQAKLNSLDVDVRTDIYSLGVLLYELLTGTTPLEQQRLRTAALDEAVRMIRQEEPPRPSLRLSTSATLSEVANRRAIEPTKLRRLVRGELDWIVMKALDKDRSRRYEAAATFAEDIRRYLAHERVIARPPTPVYLMRKFARRNRAPVIAGGLLLLMLLMGLGFTLYAWRHMASLYAEQRQELYRSDMTATLAALERGNYQEATELLSRYIPKSFGERDLRGVEWRYLWNLSLRPRTTPTWTSSARTTGITLSADKRRAAVSMTNGTVSIIDVSPDGRITEVLTGEIGGSSWSRVPFALSPCGEFLTSMGQDRQDLVIRQISQTQESRYQTPSEIEGMFSIPNADYFLLVCQHELVRVGWRDGLREAFPFTERALAADITFRTGTISPDGTYLALTDKTGDFVVLWNIDDQCEEVRFPNNSAPFSNIAFDEQGDWLAAASLDGKIFLHDRQSSTLRASRILHGSPKFAFSLTFSPNGKLLAAVCGDGTIRTWDVASGRMTRVMRNDTDRYAQIFLLDDDGTLAHLDGSSLRVRHPDQFPSVAEWKRDRQVRDVVFTDDEHVAFYELMQPNVHLQSTFGTSHTESGFLEQIWALDHHQDAGLVVGQVYGALSVVDMKSGRTKPIDTRSKGVVWSARFDAHGRTLAAGMEFGIRVWEFQEDAWKTSFEVDDPGTSVTLAADRVAWGDSSGKVAVWNWKTRKPLWEERPHRGEVYSVEFSPDGLNLLSCSLDGSIKLWNTTDGRLLAERTGEVWPWRGIFLPDDSAILTTGGDCYVTLRDRKTLAPLFRFPQLFGPGKCLAVSPSGNRLAVGTFLGQLQVWDIGPVGLPTSLERVGQHQGRYEIVKTAPNRLPLQIAK